MSALSTFANTENTGSAQEFARSTILTGSKPTESMPLPSPLSFISSCEWTNALIAAKFENYTDSEKRLISSVFEAAMQAIEESEIANNIHSKPVPKSSVIYNIMKIAAIDNQPMSALMLKNMLINELLFADVHPTLPSYISNMVYDDMITLMEIGKNYQKQSVAKSIGQLAFQLQENTQKSSPLHIVNSAFSCTLLESLGFIYKEFGVWQLTDLGGHFLICCSPKHQICDDVI